MHEDVYPSYKWYIDMKQRFIGQSKYTSTNTHTLFMYFSNISFFYFSILESTKRFFFFLKENNAMYERMIPKKKMLVNTDKESSMKVLH